MGILGQLSDITAPYTAAADSIPNDSGEFSKGLRRGAAAAGGQIRALAGGVGEALGADGFAKEQYAKAQQDQQEAAQAHARVGSYTDVHGLHDAYDYLAGLAGSAAPVIGVGLGAAALTRGQGLRPLVNASLATAPFEMGGSIERQQADPEALKHSAGERLAIAGGEGLLSSAAQNIVPVAMGGKLFARAAESAAGQSAKAIIAKNTLEAVGGNAIAAPAAEKLHQTVDSYLNPNRDTSGDIAALKEAAVSGAVLGLPFAGLGSAGEIAHSRRSAAPSDSAAPSGPSDSAAPSAFEVPSASAAPSASDFLKNVRGVFTKKTPVDMDMAQKIAGNEELVSPADIAAASPEQAAQVLKASDQTRVSKVGEWAQNMLGDAALAPETRAKLETAATDLGDRANQAYIASLQVAKDVGAKASAKISDLYNTAVAKFASPDASPDATRSEVNDGARQQISEVVAPFAADVPSEQMPRLSDAIARIITKAREDGQVSDVALGKLQDVLGDNTRNVLMSVHDKLMDTGDATGTDNFYKVMAELADGGAHGFLPDTVRSALDPQAAKDVTPAMLAESVQYLKDFVSERYTANKPPAQAAVIKSDLYDALKEHFGDKTDAVLNVFAEDAKRTSKDSSFNDRAPMTEAENGSVDAASQFETPRFYGKGKDGTGLVQDEATHRQMYNNDNSPAQDMLAKARRENPDRNVAFVAAKDLPTDHPGRVAHEAAGLPLDGHGIVVAEGMKQEGRITPDELNMMKLDTSKSSHLDSTSRIDTGVSGVTLDAKRVAQTMHGKLEYNGSDDKSSMHRLARSFMEGIAAAQDHLGKTFDVKDNVVVARRNGMDVTFGALKKLDFSPEHSIGEHAESDISLSELRRKLSNAQLNMDAVETAMEPLAARDKAGEKLTFDERTRLSKAREQWAFARRAERSLEEAISRRDAAARLQELKDAAGKSEIAPDEQTPIAALEHGDALQRHVGLDGAALTYARGKGLVDKRGVLTKDGRSAIASVLDHLEQSRGAIKRRLGDKGRLLETRIDRMTPRDQTEFARIAKETNADLVSARAWKKVDSATTVADSLATAEIINRLFEKYRAGDASGAKAGTFPERVLAGGESLKSVLANVEKSSDAHMLQASVAQLLKLSRGNEHSEAAIRAINKRLGELVSDNPEKAYSLLRTAEHAYDPAKLDAYIGAEKFQTIKDPETMVRFLRAARRRMDDLNMAREDRDLTPAEERAYYWAYDQFKNKHADLAPFLTELDAFHKLPDAAQKSLLGEVEGLRGARDASMQRTGKDPVSDASERAVRDYIEKVLGKSVEVELAKILHAGEYERVKGIDVVRVSVHSLDPMSVAAHESLHAFFQQLRDVEQHDAAKILFRAADSAMVINQLRKRLANEPEALRQIENSAEERAAYMYQFWSKGELNLGDGAKSVMTKIADFFRKVLGIWSNDERALHIMEYFHSGEYAKESLDRGAVARSLDAGTNPSVQSVKRRLEPLMRLSTAIASVGDARLRDSHNPALTKLADLVYRQGSGHGHDQGFIPASREARAKAMNKLASALKDINAEDMQAALESLQRNSPAPNTASRLAAVTVRKTLDDMFTYMTDAGVKVRDLGFKKDYFPRVWDEHYLSTHQTEFRGMLQKYIDSGEFVGNPEHLIAELLRQEGSEIGVEPGTSGERPGMQHAKKRLLSFISPEDAAPFLQKNLYRTLNSYISQATRRAEWARRFGDNGEVVTNLLAEAADKHGASPEEIAVARQYMSGIDGSLGSDISPRLRRAYSNMIVYQNIRLLPLAVFSSIVDPMGIMVRGGSAVDAFSTFKRGIKEIALNFKKEEGVRDSGHQLALDMGTIDDKILMHTIGSAYAQGVTGDTARKIGDTFFRFNLMEQFNTSMRVGATEAAVKFLARHADGKANQHSTRWLAQLGFEPGEIPVKDGRVLLHQYELESAGMSPDGAAAMSNRLSAAVNKWVDGAVLRPDAAHKPIWMNDPHWALIAHLKQFTYSFHETILKRVISEMRHGNYNPAMALSAYVPVMIAADLVKGMIQGGGQQPDWKEGWGPSDYLWSGVQRAGLLGVGQFGSDVATDVHRGGIGVGALAGPTLDQLGGAVHVVGGNGEFAPFALKAMPANALYSASLGGQATDPAFNS